MPSDRLGESGASATSRRRPSRVGAGALRDSPRLEHAADLEPEVVVVAAGGDQLRERTNTAAVADYSGVGLVRSSMWAAATTASGKPRRIMTTVMSTRII